MDAQLLIQLAIILAAAKIGGEICERWLKQPAVLGELVGGVLVGQSVFRLVNGESAFLIQLAELGAILLLFEVGLECDIDELFQVGFAALWVAGAGVILPFGLGFAVAEAVGRPLIQSIFVGAALTATSVGITARVFSDLHALKTKEARIVLGAAVADDVIGLIILAAVSGLAITRVVSFVAIARLTGLAVLFLVGAVYLGLRATPFILQAARKMQTRAAVSCAAIIFCLLLSALANMAQLAPIVGAFAAGLVLAKTEHKVHFEAKIKSMADIFVPVFFVMMGARMNIQMFNPATTNGRTTLILGCMLLVVAIIGKVLGGLSVPGRGLNRVVVGIGMIPRGEVGLIFASLGLTQKVIDAPLYAAIIFVVIMTTFITPPMLKIFASRLVPTPPGGPSESSSWGEEEPLSVES